LFVDKFHVNDIIDNRVEKINEYYKIRAESGSEFGGGKSKFKKNCYQ
jgi:hypothetical protein